MENKPVKKAIVVRSYFGKSSRDSGESVEQTESILQDKVSLLDFLRNWVDDDNDYDKEQMDDFLNGKTNFLEVRETGNDWDDPNRYTFTIYTKDELKSLFDAEHQRNLDKFKELFN